MQRFKNLQALLQKRCIYVILFYAKYDGELKSILQKLARRASFVTRPKCLVIYFHSNEGEQTFRTISERAWKEKFLDFIIDINVNLPRSVPTIVYYNPFESKGYVAETIITRMAEFGVQKNIVDDHAVKRV